VRPAEPRDLDDLVQLRLENGRVHAVLDPSVYRVPDSKAMREHFDARLMADDNDQALLVGVVDGRVLGLAEVSLDPPPPAHPDPAAGAERAPARGRGRPGAVPRAGPPT